MKKIFNQLFLVLLTLMSFFIGAGFSKTSKPTIEKNNVSLQNRFAQSESARVVNPMYPNIELNTEVRTSKAQAMTSGCGTNGDTTHNTTQSSITIDTTKYAKNIDDFKNQYKDISFDLTHSHTDDKLGFKFRTHPDLITLDLSKNYNKTKFYKDDGANARDRSNSVSYYSMNTSDNDIEITIYMEANVWKNGGSCAYYETIAFTKANNFKISSKYNLDKFKQQVINNGQKTITYHSRTGSTIDSESTIDPATLKPTGKANKTEIDKLLRIRAEESFGSQWTAYKDYGVTYQLVAWDSIKNEVTTVYMLHNQEFLRYTTKIKLIVDQDFWDMNFLKRLEIKPGKVVDLTNPAKTVEDVPELIQKKNEETGANEQTFIYHNAMTINFASGNNRNEKLLVNGKDTEVWQNVFTATLTDGRSTTDSIMDDKNTYVITVEVDGKEEFKRTIKINSLNPNVDFKWMGWDPQNTPGDKNKYDQWVLTQPFIGGVKNELYDPYINPKTGTRTQSIFVNEKPLKEPFLIDPKDRYGQIIGGEIADGDYRWGYFAEAYVVNKGILYEFKKEQLEQLAKIERVEINPENFQEIGHRETVDVKKELQFSNPGTWHYIFYLKDNVNKTSWGENSIQNPPNGKDILATQGSAIHKIITLDSAKENYRRFLDLEASQKNSKVHEWFTVPSGGHLRTFMLSNNLITPTEKLELIKYEEIVKYWRQYVSAAINGHMTYDPEKDDRANLENWSPIYFPMRKKEELAAREYIIQKIKLQMLGIGTSIYQKDYTIESMNGTPFEKMDLSQFVSISEKNPVEKLDLKVVSTPESLNIVNSLTVGINNDISFDEDLYVDLSTVKFKNHEGNWGKWLQQEGNSNESFYKNYLLDYVSETLDLYRKAKNETLIQIPEKDENGNVTGNLVDKVIPEYQYGKDYAIFINGNKLDIEQELSTKEYINDFLNAKKFETMWVRVKAIRGTVLLGGGTDYKIINDPKSSHIPDPKPTPEKPDKPEPPIIDDKSNKGFGGFWWLLILPIVAIGTIFTIMFVKRRKKMKKFKLK
ncbi:Mbov_0399 family ICE element protein [Williamsoniiplasma lucivorax]|uniref:Uncharacterized protein n=1 Tax=Williamsoniiplasma lucivorax TaxID=209274 RepID=A0A2S5RF74_9MOLU|nr:hypothetical protein [Williamsoniiplasma lucivorax]PPE05963.1 hypothetical protein ELUCI_v1c02540 [Williamsoniiplasma lucivorax]